MNEIDRAWLAAVVDSEGSIYLNKVKNCQNYDQPKLSIVNTNREFLEVALTIIRKETGTGSIHRKEQSRSSFKATKPCYLLQVSGKKALCVIESIAPYLIIKKEKAQEVVRRTQANFENAQSPRAKKARRQSTFDDSTQLLTLGD